MQRKKEYEYDEAFNIFDEIDNNHHKLSQYSCRNSNMINKKNEMLVYLKITEWKLIDMFTTSSIIRKINDVSYKGYVDKN